MTETSTVVTPAASQTAPGGSETVAVPATQVAPEGFVPVAELEAERQRSRAFQSEKDRIEAEFNKSKATPVTPALGDTATPPAAAQGFDPEAFLRKLEARDEALIARVQGAGTLSAKAAELKTQFPHADWTRLEANLGSFASPEALFIAAEADHKRVADIITANLTPEQKAERERLAAANAGAGGPATQTVTTAGGDPTTAQVAAMTMSELDALEKSSPGILERVKARAMSTALAAERAA